MFRRNILLPYSGLKSKPWKQAVFAEYNNKSLYQIRTNGSKQRYKIFTTNFCFILAAPAYLIFVADANVRVKSLTYKIFITL
jgi:hypothetical protein